ncbi:hypothetical protein AM588_10010090 [Phytophthora nicotianae]|uniref:Myb/SANT-like domain-containing protein n=1 Tax=Phytophthora nicotianae TaxID=4792 RepID=A0A0W8DFG4_PHYNI|nr:hypothetical protein AM588_10010090 [Phytophthora nicotianae]
MKQAWGYQRAVWDHARERVLLDVFEKTRRDPKLRTDRGLKSGAGTLLPNRLTIVARAPSTLVRSANNQLKSKYARLMMDYELFKDVGGERNLSEEIWDQLIVDMPDSAARLSIFKKSGFPHCDVCRRIAIERDEGIPTVKRPIGTIAELPDTKRRQLVHSGARKSSRLFTWGPREEKLVLFLCWKAKVKREKTKDNDEVTKPKQVFLDATNELNLLCKTNFTEDQFKGKYLELMHGYEQFNKVTGFSGDLDTVPKSDADWTSSFKSIQRSSDGMEPASANEFLVTGALKRSEVGNELNTESVNAVAAAQATLSANTLSQLLPATATTLPTGQHDPAAAAMPAFMTQELHDNLNMFLKTATAYLVMAINDHNQESNK